MSTTKRPRQRQAGPRSASPPPPSSKRLKASHTPASSGLGFLIDEQARSGKRLQAKLTNGVSRSGANRVDESHALAAEESSEENELQKGNEVIDISSGEESSDLEEEGEAETEQTVEDTRNDAALINGHAEDEQAATGDEDLDMADAEPAGELTFGDMLQARHPMPIDVQRSLQTRQGSSGSLVPVDGRKLIQPATAGSLGTVLTQALKTNDKDLLESCFAMADVTAIRFTIERQHSAQIATLLQRIAERIHKRPGRAGRLMIWIQWSLVTHGGYLANQPELMKKLKALAQVTRERANGLQPLLHLKGKLDLLSAQLEARRNMHARSRAAHADNMDDEQGVLYIEGQDTAWSSDDDEEAGHPFGETRKRLPGLQNVSGPGEADLLNGFINGVEDETSADEEDERYRGLVDDEAEEASSDEEGSDEEAPSIGSSDEDDEDRSDGDESEVEVVRQPKPQNLNRKR